MSYILYAIAIYLIGSVIAGSAVGMLMKKARCNQDGVSWREDTRLQDEAQLHFLHSRRMV